MAPKRKEAPIPKVNYVLMHKLKASVALLSFVVIVAAGIMSQVSLTTILVRSTLAIVVVVIVSRVIIQMLVTYEEMESGEG